MQGFFQTPIQRYQTIASIRVTCFQVEARGNGALRSYDHQVRQLVWHALATAQGEKTGTSLIGFGTNQGGPVFFWFEGIVFGL
jgi:hypothetical protein